MSDSNSLEAAISGFLSSDLLSGETVADDEELLLTDRLDSLGVVRLVAFAEKEFALSIPPSDVILDNMRSITAFCTYLRETHSLTAKA